MANTQVLRLQNPSKRTNTTALLLLLPGTISVLLLAIVPLLLILKDSFATSDPYGRVMGGFTLDNYAALFDPAYGKTIVYSLGMAALNTVFCLVAGYVMSTYLVSRSPRTQALLIVLIIIPFWTDFLVRTFAWINLLGSGGPVLSLLGLFGIHPGSIVPSQTAVMFGMLYSFLPTAIFPIYASMRSIDPSLREAASDLGCGWWATHFRVLIPLSKTGIVGAFLLTFVPTLGVFVIPVLLGGGKDPLVGNLIVTLYTEFRNQPQGAALSIALLVLMAVAMLVAALFMGRRKKGIADG